jgi:WhiB family transcriptional regulator, redox-sensing transcriptional regulator
MWPGMPYRESRWWRAQRVAAIEGGSHAPVHRAARGRRARLGDAVTTTILPAETVLACGTNPDLFFAESPVDVARAKALCRECPVREACLADALNRGEPWGVWGGELFLNGTIIASKRARGRPRKEGLAA